MASPKLIAWGQCPLSPCPLPCLEQWGNREWPRTAQSRLLITSLTKCSHICPGLSQGLPQLHPCERHLSVDRAGRCFQPHNPGNAKTQTKPFDWSLPPPQPRSGTIVSCCLCRMLKYPLDLMQGWLGTKPDPQSFPQDSRWYKPHQLSGTTVRQNIP